VIVFDTETTGLIQHSSAPLDTQPEIIEFAAIKLDPFLDEVDRLTFLCKPARLPLPAKITEITGLKDADLIGQPSFARQLPLVENFFRGEECAVAHNCAYDIGMTELELRRLGRVTRFPWPTQQLCTVELTKHLKGHRLKLGELYQLLTGKEMRDAHRAMNDVEQLCEAIRAMRTEGMI
jgi:DNA polymerase III epsilon subunit-like protein